MSTKAFDAYRTVTTATADPITLTTMLFDGGVKAIKRARMQFESQNRLGFVNETERAYLNRRRAAGHARYGAGRASQDVERHLRLLYATHR